MGMVMVWRRLTSQELDQVRVAPDRARALLFGEDETAGTFILDPDTQSAEDLMGSLGFDRERAERELWMARMVVEAGGRIEIPVFDDAPLPQPGTVGSEKDAMVRDSRTFEWEKTWDVLHFLLTGTTDDAPGPAGFVVTGGTPIGPDLGLEPARLLTPDQVSAAEAVLSRTTPEALAARLTPAAVASLRPFSSPSRDWTRPGVLEDRVLSEYRGLRAFFAAAARDGDGMLICLA